MLYLFSCLVFPEDSGDWDLRTYYYEHSRRIHGLLALAIVANGLSEYAMLRHVEIPALAVMRGSMVAALGACAIWNKNELLHRTVVPMLLLAGAAMPSVLNVEILQ